MTVISQSIKRASSHQGKHFIFHAIKKVILLEWISHNSSYTNISHTPLKTTKLKTHAIFLLNWCNFFNRFFANVSIHFSTSQCFEAFAAEYHCTKSVFIWSFSCLHFPTFERNTEIYRINLSTEIYGIHLYQDNPHLLHSGKRILLNNFISNLNFLTETQVCNTFT